MEEDINIVQNIIYIIKLVLTSIALLVYLIVIITYIFKKTQKNLLYLYNILLLLFGIIHSSSILLPQQTQKSILCIAQSLMNILSNMFIRQISTLIILFVYYQFIKPFRVKPSYILKSFLYLGLTVIYGVASCFFDQFEPQKYTLFCWNTNIYFTASYLVVDLLNFLLCL